MEHKNKLGYTGVIMSLQRLIYLIIAAVLMAGCGKQIDRVYVPRSLTSSDSLYLGQTFSELYQSRHISKVYATDGDNSYALYKQYKFFNKTFFDFDEGYVSGITLMTDRAMKMDFDTLGILLLREYHSSGRRRISTASGDTTVYRIWKLGPKLYAWASLDCVRNNYAPPYCSMMFYLGPDGEWDGLPEWK